MSGTITERVAALEAQQAELLRTINGQLGDIKKAIHEGNDSMVAMNHDFLQQPMKCMKMFEEKLAETKRSTQWTVRRWLGIPATLMAVVAIVSLVVAIVHNLR